MEISAEMPPKKREQPCDPAKQPCDQAPGADPQKFKSAPSGEPACWPAWMAISRWTNEAGRHTGTIVLGWAQMGGATHNHAK